MTERRRRVRDYSEPYTGMTAMIDVVFLLLVFFIVTLDPKDILAGLEVGRPQALPPVKEEPTPPMYTLTVTANGYLANGTRTDLEAVDRYLHRMNSKYGTDEAHIVCHDDSAHTMLVQALDICAKNGITNLSMTSR